MGAYLGACNFYINKFIIKNNALICDINPLAAPNIFLNLKNAAVLVRISGAVLTTA